MIYIYDNAIVQDLINSFNPDHVENPLVRVTSPEESIGLAAQIQNDEIQFPIVAVTRSDTTNIDGDRWHFGRVHSGIATMIDNKTNDLYYEKSIPIHLEYDLTVLTTRTADMDEIVRELIFKYSSMYFLTVRLPYECDRKVRFGVEMSPNTEIQRKSASLDYIESGQLYQTIIHLVCQGCVLVSYTPAKLLRTTHEIEIAVPGSTIDDIKKDVEIGNREPYIEVLKE